MRGASGVVVALSSGGLMIILLLLLLLLVVATGPNTIVTARCIMRVVVIGRVEVLSAVVAAAVPRLRGLLLAVGAHIGGGDALKQTSS